VLLAQVAAVVLLARQRRRLPEQADSGWPESNQSDEIYESRPAPTLQPELVAQGAPQHQQAPVRELPAGLWLARFERAQRPVAAPQQALRPAVRLQERAPPSAPCRSSRYLNKLTRRPQWPTRL